MEHWRSVVGFPAYEVSDQGRVRRVAPARGATVGAILRPRYFPYASVALTRDGEVHARYVHQLVLEAFVGPRPPGHEVDHVDHDRLNNRRSNLEYVTPAENKRRAAAAGLMTGRPPRVSGEAVAELRAARLEGRPLAPLAARLGLSSSHASRIARRKSRAAA